MANNVTFFHNIIMPKIEKKTPRQKHTMNPLILVDQLNLVASDISVISESSSGFWPVRVALVVIVGALQP